MSEQVKRYDPAEVLTDRWEMGSMDEAADGEYVRWDDYDALHAEVEALRAAGSARVESWRDQILRENPKSEPGYWPDALIVAAMSREIEQLRAALLASHGRGEQE